MQAMTELPKKRVGRMRRRGTDTNENHGSMCR